MSAFNYDTGIGVHGNTTYFYAGTLPYDCSVCGRELTPVESPRHEVVSFYWKPTFLRIPGMAMDRMIFQQKRETAEVCSACVEHCDLCGECVETDNEALFGCGVTFDGKPHHAHCASSAMVESIQDEGNAGRELLFDLDDLSEADICMIVAGRLVDRGVR